MKRDLDDLAVFGGRPEFTDPVVLGTPSIGSRHRFDTLLGEALDRAWLTNQAPLVRRFERRVAEIAGTRHAVATCNATLALQLGVRALGLSGEVIVPALTFAATAHAVSWLGLRPRFCDVDPETGTLDWRHAERLIGPSTSAIVGVHLWGRPCAVDRLADVAHRHRVALLYDAAHAFGCTAGGRPVGGFGDAEVFSFHSTKFVNSFEGGALVTDDDRLAEVAASMRNFGITGPDEVGHIGVNAKMHEASAAMGLTSIAAMPRFLERNTANYRAYLAGLAGAPGIRPVVFDERERNNYQYQIVLVYPGESGMDRDALAWMLHAENVVTRRYFSPGCHTMAPYADGTRLPHTERLAERCLALPTAAAVDPSGIDRITALIRFLTTRGAEVSDRLAVGATAGPAG